MSADPSTGTPDPAQFLVRPDGSILGDDGASGALAAALPYTGRLARRVGEIVHAGDLRLMEAIGREHLIVGVTWTPAGEGTFRAVGAPLAPRTVPSFTVGAVDTTAAVAHCLTRLAGLDGVAWCSLTTASSRVIGTEGEPQDVGHLAEAGTRMLAILRSLQDLHATGFVRLGFEQVAVVGASLGRHALVASVCSADDDELVAIIDEVRAILADHDLSTVATDIERDVQEQVEPTPAPSLPAPPPLVGARFGGGRPRADRGPRRSRRGR
jgi:hypothetical protein